MYILLKRKGVEYSCFFDDEDFELINKYKWRISGNGYAIGRLIGGDWRESGVYMHRLILNILYDKKLYSDHINHDILDNRRENLRVVTQAQNNKNKGVHGKVGYVGVCHRKSCSIINGKKYTYDRIVAQIYSNGKHKFLGNFKDDISAAKAYDEAAKKYHGEFANLNFK